MSFSFERYARIASKVVLSSSVTKYNYFMASKGIFEAVDKNEFKKYIPENWTEKESWAKSIIIYDEKFDFNFLSFSKRWESISVYYVNESEDKLIRFSDHWSGIQCENIANCNWKLNDDSQCVELPTEDLYEDDDHEVLDHQIIGKKMYCGIVSFSDMRSNFTDFPVDKIDDNHYVDEIIKEMTKEDWDRLYESGTMSMACFLALYDYLDFNRMSNNDFHLILPYQRKDRKKLDKILIHMYYDGEIKKINDFLSFVENEDRQFLFVDWYDYGYDEYGQEGGRYMEEFLKDTIKDELFNCDYEELNKQEKDSIDEIYDFFINKNLLGKIPWRDNRSYRKFGIWGRGYEYEKKKFYEE